MANHQKPTKAELEANIQKGIEDLDKLPPENAPAAPEVTPAPVIEPAPIVPAAPVIEDPKPAEPAPVVVPEVTPAPVVEPPLEKQPGESETDWQKRYTDSSREANVLRVKNREIDKAVDAAANLAELTDEDMVKEYPEWDEMTATEQRLAKDNTLNKKRFELVHGATEKFRAVEQWNEKVDTFIGDPRTLITYPELEGKQEEFKQFASKGSRQGLDDEDLVLAFMGQVAKNKPAPNKGAQFENGTGGSNQLPKPADDKISLAEADLIRQTDYPRFKRLLKEHKIKDE